jgi:hypothetical protein
LAGKRHSIGSGSNYARCAMDLGATAASAVKAASKYDPGTNDIVNTLRLKG